MAELGWLQGLARSLVGDPSVAEDLAQEAYLVALERPPRTARSGAGLRAWLATVTRNLARGRRRGERRRARREAQVARGEADARDVVEQVELRRDLVATVLRLEEPYRSTLLHYHFEERSVAEIAEAGGLSRAAVRQRLVRARASLRERLASSFGEGEAELRRALAPLLRAPVLPQRPPRRSGPSPLWLWPVGLAAAYGGLLLSYDRAPAPSAPMPEPGATPPTEVAYEPQPRDLVPSVPEALERGGLARWLVDPGVGARRASQLESALPPVAPGSARSRALPARQGRDRWRVAAVGGGWTDDTARLSSALSLVLSDMRPLASPTESLLQRVARHSGHPARALRGVRMYRGGYLPEDAEGTLEVSVVSLALDPERPQLELLVAVAQERIVGLCALGSDDLESDPRARWSIFLEQLLRVQSNAPAITFERPAAWEVRAQLEELGQRTDEDARLARSLLEQRVAMAGHSMALQAKRTLDAVGLPREASWYVELAARVERLGEASAAFGFVLGEEGAGAYRRAARSAAEGWRAVEEGLRRGDVEALESADRAVSQACSDCHRARTDDGLRFFDVFDDYAEGLELPRGVLQVGVDVAPALGDDGQLSRRLASACRAACLLANERDSI